MAEKYTAEIGCLKLEKIGTKAHGTLESTVDGAQCCIYIEMFDTPLNVQHWEHSVGFSDGKPAEIATAAQELNGDGFVDLPETEPVLGTTMVPFELEPLKSYVPNDSYPVAELDGHQLYDKLVDLKERQKASKAAFGSEDC